MSSVPIGSGQLSRPNFSPCPTCGHRDVPRWHRHAWEAADTLVASQRERLVPPPSTTLWAALCNKNAIRSLDNLEHLGDSVWHFAVCKVAVGLFGDLGPDGYTAIRMSVERNQFMTSYMIACGIDSRWFSGDKAIADSFESRIAALYLEKGLDAVLLFILSYVLPFIFAAYRVYQTDRSIPIRPCTFEWGVSPSTISFNSPSEFFRWTIRESTYRNANLNADTLSPQQDPTQILPLPRPSNIQDETKGQSGSQIDNLTAVALGKRRPSEIETASAQDLSRWKRPCRRETDDDRQPPRSSVLAPRNLDESSFYSHRLPAPAASTSASASGSGSGARSDSYIHSLEPQATKSASRSPRRSPHCHSQETGFSSGTELGFKTYPFTFRSPTQWSLAAPQPWAQSHGTSAFISRPPLQAASAMHPPFPAESVARRPQLPSITGISGTSSLKPTLPAIPLNRTSSVVNPQHCNDLAANIETGRNRPIDNCLTLDGRRWPMPPQIKNSSQPSQSLAPAPAQGIAQFSTGDNKASGSPTQERETLTRTSTSISSLPSLPSFTAGKGSAGACSTSSHNERGTSALHANASATPGNMSLVVPCTPPGSSTSAIFGFGSKTASLSDFRPPMQSDIEALSPAPAAPSHAHLASTAAESSVKPPPPARPASPVSSPPPVASTLIDSSLRRQGGSSAFGDVRCTGSCCEGRERVRENFRIVYGRTWPTPPRIRTSSQSTQDPALA